MLAGVCDIGALCAGPARADGYPDRECPCSHTTKENDGVTIIRLPLLAGATNSSAGALRERRCGPGAAGWQDPAFAASSAAGAVPVHLDLCWRGAVRAGRAGHPLHPHTATASCARLQGRRDEEAHLEMIDDRVTNA